MLLMKCIVINYTLTKRYKESCSMYPGASSNRTRYKWDPVY